MKMKSIVIALLALVITQSLSAARFVIRNFVNNNRYIEVDPIWTGRSPGNWIGMAQGAPKSFDSGLHHLKEIRWKLPTGWCWVANVEDIFGGLGRFRTDAVITIYEDGWYTIDLGPKEGIRRQANKGMC